MKCEYCGGGANADGYGKCRNCGAPEAVEPARMLTSVNVLRDYNYCSTGVADFSLRSRFST